MENGTKDILASANEICKDCSVFTEFNRRKVFIDQMWREQQVSGRVSWISKPMLNDKT